MSKRAIASALVLALTTAACGSHLSGAQLRASDALGGAKTASAVGVGSSDGGAATASTLASGAASDDTAGGAGTADLPAGGSTATTVAGAATTLPPGGNGGATDVGVTGTTITIGTLASLTGPVPGLFRGAVLGTQACAARVNARGGIYGRQLKVVVGDDQTNEQQMRAQATKLAGQALAFVGSFSLYDGALVAPAQAAGISDVGTALQPTRSQSPVNTSPQPTPPGWGTGGLAYLKAAFPAVSQHVGLLENDLSATQNAGIKSVLRKLGMALVDDQGFGATTTDFTAQVFRMKNAGVRFLIVTGDTSSYAKVLQAANQQGLKLDVFNPISNGYDPKLVQLAGPLANGTIIYSNQVMFEGEDAKSVPEVADFDSWMARIDPDAVPDTFAMFGWASCLLFTQAATAVGPHLTRQALRQQLAKVTHFDANGLLAPTNPAGKQPPTCYIVIQLVNGHWQRRDSPPPGFRCDGTYLRP